MLAEFKMAENAKNSATDEETLKEVCGMNGINYAKIAQNLVEDVAKIEVLFSPFCKLATLKPFVNLTLLRVLKCDVVTLEGLQFIPKLQELYVIECGVRTIAYLENCVSLKKLYLYGNKISKIEGLECLKDLQVLWLNANQISTIEGLDELKQLVNLSLAENCITKVGNSLEHLTSLETLDLSANKITSFKDLTSLAKLARLKSLSLKDPMCGPNPVCLLCNCTTHILYHMPSLTHLDSQVVTTESVREVESIVLKKKMYYNMRVKTVRRNMAELLKQLDIETKKAQNIPVNKLLTLTRTLRSVERELIELGEGSFEELETFNYSRSTSALDPASTKAAKNVEHDSTLIASLKEKVIELKSAILKWSNLIKQLDMQSSDFKLRIKSVADASIQRLTTELESGGNVRFEDGLPSDPWYTSCRDLVMSRFCASSLRQFDIQGIRIQRITRLHNRMLRLNFDDKLDDVIDESQSRNTSQFKKKFEYLFYTWNPNVHQCCKDTMDLYEQGLPDLDFYESNSELPAIPLTNSVSLAEKQRLHKLHKTSVKRLCDQEDASHGQLLVCKVYLGRTVLTHDTSRISAENFPNVDSVFNPISAQNTTGSSAQNDANDSTQSKTAVGSENSDEHSSCSSNNTANSSNNQNSDCDCITRQCNWFLFDKDLVVPEYIVDFNYSFRTKSSSPFVNLPDGVGIQGQSLTLNERLGVKSDLETDDTELISSTLKILPNRLRFTSACEDILLKVTGESILTNITVLNLHHCGINRAKPIPTLPNLTKLIISYNELTRLEDFGKIPTLEYLDVTSNKLNTLEGLKNLTMLKYLDISWNELCNSRDDVAILRKHAPNIVHLNLAKNPWRKAENLRLRVLGRLKLLKTLDGTLITDLEVSAANKAAASARVSPTALISNGRTDSHRPRSLSLAPYSEIMFKTSKKKPERFSEVDGTWLTKITCLYLDSQHLSKLSNLERLESLKFASFRDNDITKIEGLDSCVNLEELCLDSNCIPKIEGISKLTKLKRLSLSNNVITQIDSPSTEELTSLYYLSLENNQISTLLPLSNVATLMELYLGNNQISNIREVFHLKGFQNLVILDLFGNPIVSADAQNYRLFVVYHLKSLKALDGSAISNSDLNQAREYFGGKLTMDFVADKLRVNEFTQVRELDFPSCAIRYVDLGNANLFSNLRSLNLEHNSLSSFSGLIYLDNLQVLCLNYNKIETILDSKSSKNRNSEAQYGSIESMRFILPKLEVLHLGYNGISDIASLQLDRITSVRSLFLQGNDISEVDGLHALTSLRDLVLDRNKIKNIGPTSFVRNEMLVELHLEENRLRELTNIHFLHSLQRLYLANNRLQDMSELDRLENLPNLVEVNLTNNAISRRLLHRPVLVFRQPNLEIIDGISVTDEERQKADMYFMDQQTTLQAPSTIPQIQMTDNILPGSLLLVSSSSFLSTTVVFVLTTLLDCEINI